MRLPVKTLQFALVDIDYNFHYVDNGVVKKKQFMDFNAGVFLPFLPQHPATWREFEVSFDLNSKYWQSSRAYGIPLTFVGDGATIIKDRMLLGKGYSEELYLMLLIKNPTTGIYEREVLLQIDFTQFSADPVRGVTVNAIEGGALAYLSSRDTTTYELTIDETNPAVIRVRFDGITLEDTYNYLEIDGDLDGARHIIPLVFMNSDGDSVGVIQGNPTFEFVPNTGYYPLSSNYLVKSFISTNTYHLVGTLKYAGIDSDSLPGLYNVRYIISDDTAIVSQGLIVQKAFITSSFQLPVNFTFTLLPGQKIFIEAINVFSDGTTQGGTIHYLQSDLKLTFQSRNTTSEAFALRPLDAWKQLISLMTEGKYTGDSIFLAAHNNICLTCGDALRNTLRTVVPNYKASMTVEGFFKSYSAIYNLGLKVINNVIWIEPKNTFPYDQNVQIFDLSEVTDLTYDCATEYLVNQLTAGYPDQNYDSTSASVSGGKYEPNSLQNWKLPTNAAGTNNVLDISSVFRGDARGIEAIRGGLLNKDTTDNEGDKEVFMVNVDNTIIIEHFTATRSTPISFSGVAQYVSFEFYVGNNMDWGNDDKTQIVFTSDYQVGTITVYLRVDYGGKTVFASLFQNGGSAIVNVSSNDTDGVTAIILQATNMIFHSGDVFEVFIIPFEDPSDWTLNSAVFDVNFLNSAYNLKRAVYDAPPIGVIDSTVYNIEEMTPHRQLLAWMNYIASLFYQQPGDSVTLLKAYKNGLLSTTLAGVTIGESLPEVIGNYIPQALFLPYMFKFKTRVPYTFDQVLSLMNAGTIWIHFNGVVLYCLPFGRMTSKPATSEAQNWELLVAPNNNLSDLIKLSNFGLLLTDQENSMTISDYNPVMWMKYGYTPQSQYHYKDMYEDWSYARFQRYYAKPVYFQKWQTNDSINTQVFSKGLPGITFYVYDVSGNEVLSRPLTPTANTALDPKFVLYQDLFSLATVTPGKYLFVLKSGGGQNLAVSEWQDIRINQPKTFLHQYSNTYNKPWAFFNTWGQIQFRCESILGVADPSSTFYGFEDEPGDVELLNAISFETQRLLIGDPGGVPDWVGKKINLITLLNQYFLEGKWKTRSLESKLDIEVIQGSSMRRYAVDLRPARNEFGLVVEGAEELADEDITSFMLDQQAIGVNGEGTLDIEIQNT